MKTRFKKCFVKAMSMFLAMLFCLQVMPAISMKILAANLGYVPDSIYNSSSKVPEEAEILFEDVTRREENVKHFKMGNGSYLAVQYSEPVHFRNHNNKWEDIDNTFVFESKKGPQDFDGYVNTASDMTVKFSDDFSKDVLFKVSDDETSITWSFEGSKTSSVKNDAQAEVVDTAEPAVQTIEERNHRKINPDKLSSEIEFEDAMNNVDFNYSVSSNTVKENIIVSCEMDSYEYSFILDLVDLTLVENSDGSISLFSDDEEKYIIPAPYMYDDSGKYSLDVQYDVELIEDGKYSFSVIADSEWINDDSTVFPVTIDPAIIKTGDDTWVADTYVSSTQTDGNNNNHTYPAIFVGKNSSGEIRRTLVQYVTLPTLSPTEVIVNAELQYNIWAVGSGNVISAHEITSNSWGADTVQWSNQPSYNSEPIDYETISIADVNNICSWQITDLVRKWYANSNTKYGIMLKTNENAAACDFVVLGSLELAQPCSYFIIEYRNDIGVENEFTYTSIDAGEAGDLYVNNASGNITLLRQDLVSSSSVMPFEITHVYNSGLSNKHYNSDIANTAKFTGMNVGKGWKLNIQQTIIPIPTELGVNSEYKYIWVDGDGTEHYIYLNEDNVLVDEDNLGYTLTETETSYILTNEAEYVKTFKKITEDVAVNGYLVSEADSEGNMITYTYDTATPTRIVSVSDPSGTTATLTYNSLSELTSINLNGRIISYTYDNGRMIKISDSAISSEASEYFYSIQYDYQMYQMKDYRGKYVDIEFNVDNVAVFNTKSIKWKHSSSGLQNGIEFDYAGGNSTTTRNYGDDVTANTTDDICTTYVFDYYGRTNLVYNQDSKEDSILGTSMYGYEDGGNSMGLGGKNNNITKIATTGISNENLFNNFSTSWGVTNSTIGTKESVTEPTFVGQETYKYTSTAETDGKNGLIRRVQLDAGTYTFSAYANAATAVNGTIGLWAMSASNPPVIYASSFEGSKTNANINDGWEQISIDVTFSERTSVAFCAGIDGSGGTVYFNGMKLEKKTVSSPTSINYIKDFGFDGNINPWVYSHNDYSNPVITLVDGGLSGKSVKLPGSITDTYYVHQNINVGNLPKNSFILSGWGKATSCARSDDDGSTFELYGVLEYKFKDSDGIEYQDTYETKIPFSNETSAWQYVSAAIELPELDDGNVITKIVSIDVGARYGKNVGTAYFDNISLVPGTVISIDYYNGNIESVTVNNEISNTHVYDENDNLIYLKDENGSIIEQYIYDDNGNLITVKDDEGNVIASYSYSGDRLTGQIVDGVVTNYTYNSFGEVSGTAVSATLYGTLCTLSTSSVYNAVTKTLTSYTDDRGKTTTYGYNTNLWMTLLQDANGNQTRYEYNADGSVSKVYVDTDKDGVFDTTESNIQYTFDNYKRLSGINANSMSYVFTYNIASLPEAIYVSSVSDENLLVKYTYNASYDNVTSVEYGNGLIASYTYDMLDNLMAISYNGVEKFTYTYDGNGNVIKENDLANGIVTKHLYDASGAYVGTRTTADNYTLEKYSDYNTETETAIQTYNINDTEYDYSSSHDETLDVDKYTIPTEAYIYSETDDFGRTSDRYIKDSDGNDIIDYNYIYIHDTEAYMTTNTVVGWIAESGDDINNFSYTYDDYGNLTEIHLNGSLNVRYSYDERHQVIREDNVPQYRSYTYEYDNNGNILNKKTYYLSTGMLTAQPLSTNTYTYGNSTWGDLLTNSSETGSITYDNSGNPLKWRGMGNITWEGRNLTSFVKFNRTATYSYNADGIRTKYQYNGQTTDYILDGTKILGEVHTDAQGLKSYIYYYYDENDEVIGFNYLDEDYYYIKNMQGDVMYITDAAGEILVTYAYDAWGKILSIADVSYDWIGYINPFTYKSYYYDHETGLYYLQSRYYDPTVGRFLNADSTNYLNASGTTLGCNLFAYCENNGVDRVDPTGRIYISRDTVYSIVYRITGYSRAFAQAKGWKVISPMAILIAPKLAILLSWINAVPIVGWVIFGYIVYNALKFSLAIVDAYIARKGVDISLSWGLVVYKVR